MAEIDLKTLPVGELLKTYSRLLEELRERNIIRSSNGPVADYSEFLFCNTFGWARQTNSAAGFDASDSKGVRYQIKGRRPTRRNRSRELSVLRSLNGRPFDFLAAILFNEDFTVARAALVPVNEVLEQAKFSSHVNGWRFHLRDSVWGVPGVEDVTEQVRGFSRSI